MAQWGRSVRFYEELDCALAARSSCERGARPFEWHAQVNHSEQKQALDEPFISRNEPGRRSPMCVF